MSNLCETCAYKNIEYLCSTCDRVFLGMTTDRVLYSAPSNYAGVFKPEAPSYTSDDVKRILNGFFGAGHATSPYQKAISRIKNVIFNDPATIVFWNDGTKTVVKCGKNDTFDPEKGLAMAISKYFFDNAGYFNDVFKKWLPKKGESDEVDH